MMQRERRRAVERFVSGRIGMLQNGLLSERGRSQAAATLARLRRAAGKEPGSTPEVWSIEFEGLPDELVGKGTQPSPAEWAVHAALTLYATHQQSKTVGMYLKSDWDAGVSRGIGAAVRRLVAADESLDGQVEAGEMPRRFAAMVTADSMEEVAHYARQIVQQLRACDIPLDYALLAGQLFDYQDLYARDRVRLEWAREFARRPVMQMTDSDQSNEEE